MKKIFLICLTLFTSLLAFTGFAIVKPWKVSLVRKGI